MDKQLFNILSTFNKIRYLDKNDKEIYNSFYNFFINNYKNYNNLNDLLTIYIVYNGKDKIYNTISFLNKFFNVDIKLDKVFILNEINRYNKIKKCTLSKNNIFYFNKNTKYKDNFIVYTKWFDNFIIIKSLSNNKILKLYVPNDIIKYIFINDVFYLEIIKKHKSFWSILNILDFYPNGLKHHTYNEIYKRL